LSQEEDINVFNKVSGVKGAQCAFSFTAAHLWPAKMVHSLLGKLLERNDGLNVQANTPVKSVSDTMDASGKWTIETTRGAIKATKIVYATNAYTSQILPEYTNSITPIRGICSHIDSPQGKNSPHLVNSYGIRFGGRNYDYLIPRADGSIIVGGAGQRFWHNRAHWFGMVDDSEMVEEAVSYFDGYMQRIFRGWENTCAKTKKVWTGSKLLISLKQRIRTAR
jgi:glycine/D-amino acid oxidase-like deaminating enzyme